MPPPTQPPTFPPIKLRGDLLFTRRAFRGQTAYLMEDPINGQYYRIGMDEYRLLQKLDGTRALPEALAEAITEGADLSEEDLPMLYSWLMHAQLAYVRPPNSASWQLPPPRDEKLQRWVAKANPLFLQINLGSPDRLLEILLPWLGWMLGWPFFVLWAATLASALYQLSAHWREFSSQAEQLLNVNNMIWLICAWTLIKTVHELFHGLVCKKYGGYVHRAGIFLILFAPIGGFMDTTSSWRFASRWQRMHVAAAGMFIELFLAAIAVWIWIASAPGPVHFIAYNTILVAGIVTIAFNANPLMRFDGYYILADWLDIPNLYTLGQQYIRYLIRRWLQGRRETPPAMPKPWLIKSYAAATWVWRILIMISLLYMAHTWYEGIGVILVLLAITSWLFIPFIRFTMALWKDQNAGAITRRLVLLLIALGVVLALGAQTRWPRTLYAPAVVDFQNAHVLRAESPGFIKAIHVPSGQMVRQGQLLLELENRELAAEQQELAIQLRISQLKARQYLQAQKLGEYQAEQEKIQDFQNKLAIATRQVAKLAIHAPADGKVLGENLSFLQGMFAKAGEELLTIGDGQQMELQLSIAEDDVDFFRAAGSAPVEVVFAGRPAQALAATLHRVNPTGGREIIHPALTALAGGNLEVRPATTPPGSHANAEQGPAYEYVYPRFPATVQFTSEALANTDTPPRPGEIARVALRTEPQSALDIVYAAFERFSRRLERNAQNNGQ